MGAAQIGKYARKAIEDVQGGALILLASGLKLGDEDVMAIAEAVKESTAIQILELQNNRIGDSGAIAIAEAIKINGSLDTIILNDNQIGDAGATALAEAMKTNKKIRVLNLNGNLITDKGAIALAEALVGNTTLCVFGISNKEVTDKSVPALQKLIQSSQIATLSIASSSISESGKKELTIKRWITEPTNFGESMHRAVNCMARQSRIPKIVLIPVFIIFAVVPAGILTLTKAILKPQTLSVQKEASKTAYGVAQMRHVINSAHMNRDYIARMFLSPIDKIVGDLLSIYFWFTGTFPEIGSLRFGDIIARTEMGDELIQRFVTLEGGRQVVSLGSGLDSRAYRLECLKKQSRDSPVNYFEVDVAPSQEMKLDLLLKNAIPHHHVTFVPVDFSVETFSECLKRHGWNPNERTLFLWEGVSAYLPEEAVLDTFRAFAKSAKGSYIFFDLPDDFASEKGKKQISRFPIAADIIKYTNSHGEPLKWGLLDTSKAGLRRFLEPFNLELVELLGPNETEDFFLRKADGSLCGQTFGFLHLAIARVL